MANNIENETPKRSTMRVVKAYPLGVLLIGVLLNWFVFGVNPIVVALPSVESVYSLSTAGVLLVINHTWLMTTTELTRVRFGMFATPEEWEATGARPEDAPDDGLRELERRHNAHRNTTENSIYFVFLSLIIVIVSPTTGAAQAWIVGFAGARLGYTYGYLAGNTTVRGIFMSLSLLAVYGMGSYLAISVFL